MPTPKPSSAPVAFPPRPVRVIATIDIYPSTLLPDESPERYAAFAIGSGRTMEAVLVTGVHGEPAAPDNEPPPGSVLMLHGPTGSMFQRHHSDGLYHSTTGKVKSYDEILATPYGEPHIVYRAPEQG